VAWLEACALGKPEKMCVHRNTHLRPDIPNCSNYEHVRSIFTFFVLRTLTSVRPQGQWNL